MIFETHAHYDDKMFDEDRESLLKGIEEILRPGDTVLIKASHGMGFEKIVEQLS